MGPLGGIPAALFPPDTDPWAVSLPRFSPPTQRAGRVLDGSTHTVDETARGKGQKCSYSY
jgi:hypothetical protein